MDPYYLTHKAEQIGFHPEMILAGRRINDAMGQYVVERVAELMGRKGIEVPGARVLVMGLAFKENCPDLRNTRVIDVVRGFEARGARVDVHDPWVDPAEARAEYGIEMLAEPAQGAYDAVVLAVPHEAFRELREERLNLFCKKRSVRYDVKSMFSAHAIDGRL